jgi:hypothetical protein
MVFTVFVRFICVFEERHSSAKFRYVLGNIMRRELRWIENEHFMGWGCSECEWLFDPSGVLSGKSLDEMMENFKRQRAKDFESHVCAEHLKAKNPRP